PPSKGFDSIRKLPAALTSGRPGSLSSSAELTASSTTRHFRRSSPTTSHEVRPRRLCWVLPRPNSGKALQLRADFQNAVHKLIAPSVFSGEVASALTKAERQKLIQVGDARPLLGRVMRTPPIMHAYEPLLDRAVAIS